MKKSVLMRLGRVAIIATVMAALVGPAVPVAAAGTSPSSGVVAVKKVATTAVTPAKAKTVVATPLSTTYVYITRTGAKYHRGTCRYLRYSKRKVTLRYAKSHGYTACKICRPPR